MGKAHVGFGFVVAALAALAFAASGIGCSSAKSADASGFSSAQDGGDDASFVDSGVAPPTFGNVSDAARGCVGLECQEVTCGAGATTTVSGSVYDPAGKVALYNVIVYVPNAPVEPFKHGPTCDQCGVVASGSPLTSALTDEKGHFVLQNVPVGTDVPLVMQVGKWRRQVKIPTVVACKDNPIADKNLTRLPKNQSEGDMPQMALTTGEYDALECLFLKMGIDQAEFTNGTGKGRMHIYTGYGGATVDNSTDATPFWSSQTNLMNYDIVLLSCEGDTHPETKPQAALDAMHDYASAGGRVFGTHYHYYWFQSGKSDFQSTATWTPNLDTGVGTPYTVDQSFPKGKSFAAWLQNVGATTTLGQIDLNEVAGDVSTINVAEAQQFIYYAAEPSAKYFSFNTPIGSKLEAQCGRVVYSDLHVTGNGGEAFPSACDTGDLTPQEKALEFLFFDLSSCIQDPTKPPPPPPVK